MFSSSFRVRVAVRDLYVISLDILSSKICVMMIAEQDGWVGIYITSPLTDETTT